jgi:cytoskeleton-associated protein 5
LKEKKPTMTEALSQTLQAMHKAGCISLVDIVEGRFSHQDYFRALYLAWNSNSVPADY